MIDTVLWFCTGFFLGLALASLIYDRKFKKLARAFRRNTDELDAIRASLESRH